jgi:adenylate cyclase
MEQPTKASALVDFFAELRRRRVVRVIIVYAIAGWVVIEVASTMLPGLNLPGWTVTFVIALVVLGFPIAVIMGWMFDLGPRGAERTTPAPIEAGPGPAAPPVASRVGEAAPASRPPPAAGANERRTIAVLPFVNMSGDAENEYFSDGISEEILNLLTKLPQLKVSSRTSSFVFKGKEASIPTVASELGVATVLEGSVRRAGDRVRITAQLIETASDSHLWSETYDRQIKDVFAIQDDIARSIVDALQVTLSPKERRALQNDATADATAYDFYLKGRKYFYAMSRRNFLHAISMYEEAIALDPKYALAHAGIADARSFLFRYYRDAFPECGALADEASRRAVELDPDSPEAHTSRGTALLFNGMHVEAEKHFETAILLNPNLYEPYYFFGRACMSSGNSEKAARLFLQASETNPTDYLSPGLLGQAYLAMGRRESGEQALRKSMANLERHLKMNPDDSWALGVGAVNLAELGDREPAIAWAERAIEASDEEPIIFYNSACTFAVLGEANRALDLLERAVALGWGDREWIQNDSDLASLHGNPRFRDVLGRIR